MGLKKELDSIFVCPNVVLISSSGIPNITDLAYNLIDYDQLVKIVAYLLENRKMVLATIEQIRPERYVVIIIPYDEGKETSPFYLDIDKETYNYLKNKHFIKILGSEKNNGTCKITGEKEA